MKHSHKNNFLKLWYYEIDKQVLFCITILLFFNVLLINTTSPIAADKIGVESSYFILRQFAYIGIAIALILLFSFFKVIWLLRLSVIGFLFAILILILVKFFGYEVKGATRWIKIGSFAFQPSEFIKPFFAIIAGWLLSLKYDKFRTYESNNFPSFTAAIICYLLVAGLLIIQPDLGMVVLVTAAFSMQLFVAGIAMIWVVAACVFILITIFGAYFIFPHVTSRIDSFLHQDLAENYQVSKSLAAFESGGLFGLGAGEGVVKQHLPDLHTDFVFAVAGEELGALIALIIVLTFFVIILKNILRIIKEQNLFVQFSAIGIIAQFGMQASINIGVTLNLLPTKGMTLPFISYGGSSMMATAISLGILLNLTRRRPVLSNIRHKKLI